MNKKTIYEAPEAEILNVRFEGNFCTSPNDYGPNGGVSNPEPYNGSDDDDMD